MTVTFSWLKKNHKDISDDKIIKILKTLNFFDFEAWIKFNELINPTKKIDDYIIDLPATLFDEINNILKNEYNTVGMTVRAK